MTIGEQIIAAIGKDHLFILKNNNGEFILDWRTDSAEQLEAVVDAHVAERLSESDKIIRKLIELYDQDPRGDKAGYAETLKFVRRECGLPADAGGI